MPYFPVRKCYYIAKVCLVIILVVTVLGLFEKWRGGRRTASANYNPAEDDYERQIIADEERIIPGLGEGGVAAYLTGEDKVKGEESEKKLAMNVYLSDRISYNRTLKDERNPACARVLYDAELPSASVILIFHNEPYSVVVRTIWSVINSCRRDQPWFKKAKFVDRTGRPMKLGYPGQDPSSPLVYLKEIILVDDNSTLPELKGKLSHYVRTRLPPDLIRILRLPERQGLMIARIRGARASRGDVLIFLDAHCEVLHDWMRPMLQRIRNKRDAVVTPVIDVLEQSTFELEASEHFQVGGFTFTGHFTWIDVPDREKQRRGSDIAPTWSPTMAGGLFAINRAYYWELGAYDEQMAGWGGENLEMSFRIWQCGGTLETVPCSRVGHVFRSFHPYSMPANSDTHGINTARMAEVWMDEYAELFYLHRPDLRNNPKIGDVTHRKVLREKLKCKSFQWFLDNIYKEKFVPVRDAYGYGRFRNPASNLCIDNLQREGDDAPLGVYSCHPSLQPTQYYSLSLAHELRDEDTCAYVQRKRHVSDDFDAVGRKVYMTTCHGKMREQKWTYLPLTKQIRHSESGLCLDAGAEGQADLLAQPCADHPAQQWDIDYTEDNNFRLSSENEFTEQEMKLRRLRGQRRKSRSLLSVKTEKDDHRRHKKHHKRAKKNKTKNKFILKLVRTLMNNTEDHLEVDIHCKHKQLYPNNTFVRDLVTILNERNIKVINNGRVFERNKVTQLDPKMDEQKKILNKMEIETPDEETHQMRKPKLRKHKQPSTLLGTKDDSQNTIYALNNIARNGHENIKTNDNPIKTYEQNSYNIDAREEHINAFEQLTGEKQRSTGQNQHSTGQDQHSTGQDQHSTGQDQHSTGQTQQLAAEIQQLNTGFRENQHGNKEHVAERGGNETSTKTPRSHRIIIEDFIEMTPSTKLHTKHMKRRKHKRPSTAAPAQDDGNIVSVITQKLTSNLDEQIHIPQSEERKDSIEDAPMVVESETVDTVRASERDSAIRDAYENAMNKDRELAKRINEVKERDRAQSEMAPIDSDNTIDEMWPIGESRFRSVSGRRRSRGRKEVTTRSDNNEAGSAQGPAGAAPVKVVMRSNLTFNLGDEFFQWGKRHKQRSDNELAIPSSRSPPSQDWLRRSEDQDTRDITRDETRDITRDETRDIIRDITRDETRDITRDETRDITRDETRDITRDETRDITRDKEHDTYKEHENRDSVSDKEHENIIKEPDITRINIIGNLRDSTRDVTTPSDGGITAGHVRDTESDERSSSSDSASE